jgi:putative ABC transport system permease protein
VIQQAGAAVAAPALGVALPPTSFWPVPTAFALVLLLTLGFALPPLLDAATVPPLRVFQRGAMARRGAGWSLLAAALAVVLLLRIEAGSTKLAALMLGGTAITVVLLGLAAFALMAALAPLQARAGVAWRFGLGNIARRRAASVAQIVALGVALLALLLLTVARQDLLSSWQQRLPPRTPNQFLINIQPAQIAPLRAFFAARGVQLPELWPMVRGRLVALDGKPIDPDRYRDPQTRRWINREFNLSWTERFGDDNTLLQGSWWPPATRGQPWLSVEQFAVERLGLKLGDTLTLDIAGRRVTLTVHDVRKVRWDSFRPNFFLVTPPGVLDDLNAVQWITSFYLPPGDRTLLRDLARQFPNVTAIDLQAAMDEIRRIIDRIVHALELILLFALAAGLIVVLAVMEGAREERVRETGVLRALGASSRVIVQGLIAEYLTLGLLAGAVASLAAQLLAWQLARQVFHIDYGPRPLLWLAGACGGGLLVAVTGWLSLRSTLRTPPRAVLTAEG